MNTRQLDRLAYNLSHDDILTDYDATDIQHLLSNLLNNAEGN